MLSLINIVILAVVQGVTEFLPISSSGHLVVGEHLLGMQEGGTAITIVLHFGTLISILLFYWRRILRLLGEDRRVIPLLIVGTLPAVVLGFTVKIYFDEILNSLPLAAAMFPVTGVVLLMLAFRKTDGETSYPEMSYRTAFVIGLFQSIALLPGISRSGFTIASALFLGVKRESAATFSFLLAIPVIGGAALLECVKLIKDRPESVNLTQLGVGAVVSFLVGLVSLFWLVKLVEKGKLYWFAAWLIPFGIVILVLYFFFPQLISV